MRLQCEENLVYADQDVQILIIKGVPLGSIWPFIGVYAPQLLDKVEFLKHLINKIEQYGEGNLVLMGDLNSVMNRDI